jgi:hypothetical protein
MSIPTAQLHETLIKQTKNQQEIIPNLLKDSHSIEDTNPEVVAEQEATKVIAASGNKGQSDADLETLDHQDLPALCQAKAELEAIVMGSEVS